MTGQPSPAPTPPAYALPAETALASLASSENGLSQEEAERRLAADGRNSLPAPRRRTPLRRFLQQFENVLILVLVISAVITFLLGDIPDTVVIAGVVVINALFGFVQEGKAEKAVDAVRNILSREATVVRDGSRKVIPAEELVRGDVVLLQSGDKVPADLRLLQTRTLRIDEAALTGESMPVAKTADPVPAAAAIADRTCLAFSGTVVTYGTGTGVVTATGPATELGRIGALVAGVDEMKTRLTLQVDELSRYLTVVIVAVAGATIAFGALARDYSFRDIFFASVALAVAAIPEGLPAVITITLAVGIQRMAGRRAIIRRLPAVETLGSVTVICTDKTGTLTRNEMTAKTVVLAGTAGSVTGSGYDPGGRITLTPEGSPDILNDLSELCLACVLCNDAAIRRSEGQAEVEGDPTDAALIVLAGKGGIGSAMTKELPRIDAVPFESERRYMATLHRRPSGEDIIFVKGAPEVILQVAIMQRRCGRDEKLDRGYWREKVEEIARRGERALALATRPGAGTGRLAEAEAEENLVMLGLVGLIDPPREEARRAVAVCRSAGIQVKMITGDHGITAAAIGRDLGIGDGAAAAVTGEEIARAGDDELRLLAETRDIFARVAPEHKLRLVQALQAAGHVTAMTGDGVNDAPALRRADIGIAMGKKGTEAAKEAAQMVLADDNFATIVDAVEEGRTVYDNIRKSLAFILPTNGAQAGIILVGVIAGIDLPITPLQILWINMVTAVTLALAFAFEPAEKDIMQRPPRPPKEPLLTLFIVWKVTYISIVIVLVVTGLYLWDRAHGEDLATARTAAVNTLIFFQIAYLFSSRSLKRSMLTAKIFANRMAVAAMAAIVFIQLLFTYLPPLQAVFATAPLAAGEWLRIVVPAFLVFFIAEAEKAVVRALERTGARREAALK